jgi:hypothetical protein
VYKTLEKEMTAAVNGMKHIVYLGFALGMLIFAVPRLEAGQGLTAPTLFSAAWICIALVIIASHLHFLLGVDAEKRKELARIHRAKRLEQERRLQRMLQR